MLYALIRWLLMQREGGVRVYADRWPAKLDLEEGFYRPLLLRWLPNPLVIALTRALDELTDSIVIALRHTLLGQTKKHGPVPVGTHLTYALGTVLNAIVALLNHTFYHRRPIKTDFTVALAAGLDELRSSGRLISGSMSFGLLLLCICMYLTFAYLMTLS